MPVCFVIQPFDGDKFDKRFRDVFSPAIGAAGLEPYRVDQDPRVEIPIADIERGIRTSEVCFADITTDNPNVWFELGYAFATHKPVCMVCSEEREKAFPFDVRHRSILTYKVGSSSDFQDLASRITQRLTAILKQERQEMSIEALQPHSATAGLTPHEVIALAIIVGQSIDESVPFYHLKQGMERAGFTELAAGLALRSLLRRKFIDSQECHDNQSHEPYVAYSATEIGVDWILAHQDELGLRRIPKLEAELDIPF